MTSLLVTVIVAACITFPALIFATDYQPFADILKVIKSENRSPETLMTIKADIDQCLHDTYVRALLREPVRDPFDWIPDSPCHYCSIKCSILDESMECFRRCKYPLMGIDLCEFTGKVYELHMSSLCRPDLMHVLRPGTLGPFLRTFGECSETSTKSPDYIHSIKASHPSFEGLACRDIVKGYECMKEKMPQYHDAVLAIINGMKNSRLCGAHYEEIIDSEGHDEL
ncbi:uncharacterized protein LOC124154349 isoform X1 [Ischnura elegans]|uniref:uncharacterized protein LOC124154349 isoform X1 n=1 Tax=Ischnura elegans TaxID=197161 RepID=UPI001ED8853D|nr:uncharacterized protein LOC124154349 isoform X1 [Ischnura elegans]